MLLNTFSQRKGKVSEKGKAIFQVFGVCIVIQTVFQSTIPELPGGIMQFTGL